MEENKRTCLYDKHVALGALISPFGGFDMPIQYSTIIDEHQAVRTDCGVFDVSHMGEVTVKGKDAENYVNHIFTNDVRGMEDGKILYGMMCYENGGTVDDLLVYKMADNDFFIVINAANIDNDWAWMQEHAKGYDIDLKNLSDFYGQLAVQGANSEKVVEEVLGLVCRELTFYTVKTIGDVIVSRTGYTGEDRILACHGLRQLNSAPSTGVKALMEVCGLADKEISLSNIIFKIGPRINASGRMQNGKEAVSLLVEKNYKTAKQMAERINAYNEQRKDLDKSMTEEANRIVEKLDLQHKHKAIVLYSEEWHRGIIGIVASRLTEIYHRPSVVLTRTDDVATGSARSVLGFDVYGAVDNCRDLLLNFGGHTYAAGLSMKVENVSAFRHRFEAYVDAHILPEQTCATIKVDALVNFRDINRKFFSDLKKFAPYGPENPKPVFCTKHVYDYGTSKVVGRDQEHIKLELVDSKSNNVMNGIAFGQSSQARYIKTKQGFDIVYTIEENTHKRGEVQLQIEDIRPLEQE